MTDAEKAEMYRKQLGGMNAANERNKQKVRDLEKEVERLNGTIRGLRQEVSMLRRSQEAKRRFETTDFDQ